MRDGSIRSLRAFCVAARHLSFRAAAAELRVTPSAVSHQVKALEERLHGTLFERRGQALVLTHLGSELRAEVEPVLHELDNVIARFQQRLGRRRVLRIGVTPFFASELLVPHVHEFAERNRAIELRIETHEVGAPIPSRCDATIVLAAAPPPAAVAHPLLELSLAPACSPSFVERHALKRPRDLLDVTLIVHGRRPHAWRDWFAHMGMASAQPLRTLHLDNLFAVARAAERGVGVALLPVALCDGWLASGVLVHPCTGVLEVGERYYLVHRPEALGNPDVAALRDWIMQLFGAEAAACPADALEPPRLVPAARASSIRPPS